MSEYQRALSSRSLLLPPLPSPPVPGIDQASLCQTAVGHYSPPRWHVMYMFAERQYPHPFPPSPPHPLHLPLPPPSPPSPLPSITPSPLHLPLPPSLHLPLPPPLSLQPLHLPLHPSISPFTLHSPPSPPSISHFTPSTLPLHSPCPYCCPF